MIISSDAAETYLLLHVIICDAGAMLVRLVRSRKSVSVRSVRVRVRVMYGTKDEAVQSRRAT